MKPSNLPTPIETQPVLRADAPLSVSELTERVQLVRQVMSNIMRPGIHYGAIPGCGERKTLLQPGAEVLGLAFQLAPSYEATVSDLDGGHREVHVKCTLTHAPTGRMIGQACRSCTTLEAKYRWRAERVRELPSAYWKMKEQNPAKAREMIGGATFEPRKMGGKWFVVQLVEQGNPADYFNTVAAIACKRSFVAAIRSATSASDIFTEEGIPASPEDDGYAHDPGKPEQEGTPDMTPLQRLQALMGKDGITEEALLAYAKDSTVRLVPENIQTLEEMSIAAPARLAGIITRWSAIRAKLRPA